MRYHYIEIREGKRAIVWGALAGFVVLVYAIVIGSSQAFWYWLVGDFSPLTAGFGLVISTLAVIRMVGATWSLSIRELESRCKSN